MDVNGYISNLTDSELEVERLRLEKLILETKLQLKSLVEEAKKRHHISQIKIRYGVAGEMLLEVLGVEGFLSKREELIKSGKIKENTKSIEVTEKSILGLDRKAL